MDGSWKDAATWLGLACLGVLAWLARWAWGKLDSKADRAELLELVRRQEERDKEARAARQQMYDKLDDTSAKISETAVAVARLEGRLGKG